jgi:hypothetical protein
VASCATLNYTLGMSVANNLSKREVINNAELSGRSS